MKKTVLRITALLVCVCLVGIVSFGCASRKDLKMGTNAAFPPFEFTKENGTIGQFDGIDVAIAAEIGKDANKTVSIENMDFDGLLIALNAGKVDFVAAGMTASDERRANVDFSDTYYVATQAIITTNASGINKKEALIGRRVGVVQAYTGDKLVTALKKDAGDAEPTRFTKGVDAIMDLVNGRLDAVVIDLAPAKVFVSKNPGLIVVEDATFEKEEYAIAVKKGNTKLLNQINSTLKRLKESGAIDEFIKKYENEY